MSEANTRAWMDVRGTTDLDLRERLHGALETLHEISHLLKCDEIRHVLSGVSGLQGELESAKAEVEEAEQKANVAEERLEEKLQAADEIDATKLVERIEELERENIELREKVEAQKNLSEDIRFAVGDVLAMSRKLVSKCEAAGIKPAHVRAAVRRSKESR